MGVLLFERSLAEGCPLALEIGMPRLATELAGLRPAPVPSPCVCSRPNAELDLRPCVFMKDHISGKNVGLLLELESWNGEAELCRCGCLASAKLTKGLSAVEERRKPDELSFPADARASRSPNLLLSLPNGFSQ